MWYTQNSQCIQNSIFPSGKHIFPISLILKLEIMEDLIHYMLSFKCEQSYFMKITYLNLKSEHKSSQFRLPTEPQLYFSQIILLSRFAQIFPNMQHFPNHRQSRFFFNFGICPDILTKVFQYCTTLLIWATWVLLNFYIKQKQRFSVWNFTENTPSSPFIKEFVNNKNTQ